MKRGFTLLELLIVLVLILAISTLSFPVFVRMQARSQLGNAAKSLQGELYNTRLEAMRTGSAYVFRFQGNTGLYEIMPKAAWDAASATFSDGTSDGFSQSEEIPQVRSVGTPEPDSSSLELKTFDSASEGLSTNPNSGRSTGSSGGFYFKQLPHGFVFENPPPPAPTETTSELDSARVVGTEWANLTEPLPGSSPPPSHWSAPVFFFPNGRTSNAFFAIASSGEYPYRCELTLRGLTGTTRVGQIQAPE